MAKYTFEQLRAGKFTQEEVAKYLGICTRSYQLKENGTREFTFEEILKLSTLYNVDINLFVHP